MGWLSAVAGEAAHFSPLCLVGKCRWILCTRIQSMSGGQLLGHKGDSATEVPLNNWELIRLGDGRSLRGN